MITELNLRVFGIPETIAAATVQFPAVRNAVDAVIEIVQMGIGVARSELVCDKAVAAVNKYSGLSLPEQPMLLLEFHGTPASVALEVEAVRAIAESYGGFGYRETATRANAENCGRRARCEHGVPHRTQGQRPLRHRRVRTNLALERMH